MIICNYFETSHRMPNINGSQLQMLPRFTDLTEADKIRSLKMKTLGQLIQFVI